MRVIAGEYRSRRLISLPGESTRPTPDRLREALFSILQTRISGSTFLDAYAGTGAVGIEALSRGAAHAWFLEREAPAVDAIRENLRALGAERRATVVSGAVRRTLKKHTADIVFLDPPYEQEEEYAASLELLGKKPPGLVIVQHSIRFTPAEMHGALTQSRTVRQGDNVLTFFVPEVE
jgi:16S rRNA (guanine(966)-N(2))-methyltransferase RsmD